MPTITQVDYHLRGKRRVGCYVKQDNNSVIYLAFRKHKDLSSLDTSLSKGMREDKAGWRLDLDTLMSLKAKKVKILAVRLDTGEYYLTLLEYYFNRKLYYVQDNSGSGGKVYRLLPLSLFKFVPNTPSL